MARWLREYFNLGSYKAKAPVKAETAAAAGKKKKKPRGESGSCRESDLMRAYRLQKERDFEDPYSNGPGSSLRRLKAMWPGPEDEGGCRQGPVASGSPILQRSQSERATSSSSSPRAKCISSAQQRLIKVHETAVTEKAVGNWSSPATASRKPPQPDDKVAYRDDYSDPFDAKNELKKKVVKKREIENNGYMEPYEAQKMMAEIHRQESQKKGIQLYDTPYEPEENGASDTESVDSYLRESRLPQDDARPAEEYDQPWEWNKVTVTPFSVQLNGIEKRQSSPLCDRRRQLVPPDLIKHGGLEFSDIVGERIDPNTPLEKQVWYHGAISRTDAENLLRLCKECSYLIRNSQSSKNDYSLSLKSSQGFMHMKLTRTKDKYILGQNSLPFNSVPEVIHYYTTRKLPIKGAEHLSLLYPVTVRTL